MQQETSTWFILNMLHMKLIWSSYEAGFATTIFLYCIFNYTQNIKKLKVCQCMNRFVNLLVSVRELLLCGVPGRIALRGVGRVCDSAGDCHSERFVTRRRPTLWCDGNGTPRTRPRTKTRSASASASVSVSVKGIKTGTETGIRSATGKKTGEGGVHPGECGIRRDNFIEHTSNNRWIVMTDFTTTTVVPRYDVWFNYSIHSNPYITQYLGKLIQRNLG